MKILMVHPHDITSNLEPWTTRITSLAAEFVKNGHSVKLVYFPISLNFKSSISSQNGLETIPLSRSRKRLFANIRALIPLARWADIVHFQKSHPHSALPALFAGYLSRKPIHYDWDDWELAIYKCALPSRLISYYLCALEGLLPGLVNTVSVASGALHKMALGLGVDKQRVFDAPVGADLVKFSPEANPEDINKMYDIEGKVVMYLGQLHTAQYAELFLNAAKIILDRTKKVTFMVVGGGSRFWELYTLAAKLGIMHKVIFTGAVDHELVPKYLTLADIVAACFIDNEQQRCKSPLKIAEYMAAGKAIVASDVGEVPRMMDGCGVLVRAGDPRDLARGILRLLNDENLRRECARKARLRAESEYNWKATASNLLQAYRAGVEDYRRTSRGLTQRVAEFIRGNRDIMGIFQGRRSYVGPRTLQIDLTNDCNNNCIACWCNSPLLGDERMSPEAKQQSLPLSVVKEILDDAHQMGTEEIYLAGGGEPFMHPQILQVLEYAKSKNFTCFINTNFTLVDEAVIKEIVKLGIDHLTVSIWAGTAEVYDRTHPNKSEQTFYRIKDMLKLLNDTKLERPFVKLYNVISKMNFRDIDNMLSLAQEVNADSVEFTMVDTIPGRTDGLLLSEDERQWLNERCQRIAEQRFYTFKNKRLVLFNFEQFIRRVANPDSTCGEHDRDIIDSIPCYVGWLFARVLADGNVNSCLKSHRFPVGSVYQKSLKELWGSERQLEFRKAVKVYKKDGPFFNLIGNDPSAKVGCYKSCDDLQRNLAVHERIRNFSLLKKTILRAARFYFDATGRRF